MIYPRILVPIDGSETSELGRQEALRLARDQGAEVRLVYVLDAHVAAMDPYGTINTGELIDALRQYGVELLARAQADADAQAVKATTSLVDTIAVRVGSEIVREAADWRASLIVMGTHGRRGVSHMLMGSDAEFVVRHSPVPVLLVRNPAPGHG